MKYTLDRIDDGFYVFLEFDNEENQLLIPIGEVTVSLKEGDIVGIDSDNNIKVLNEETQITLEKVNDLLERLKNKNK